MVSKKCLKYWKAKIYADDTKVTIASTDKEKAVAYEQAELLCIAEWMRVNKRGPNPSKGHRSFTESKGYKYSSCIKVK